MFYKANQPSTSVSDWIDLHTQAIPTEALAALYPVDYIAGEGELQRLDVKHCEACDGTGDANHEDASAPYVDCEACDGSGATSDVRELHAYPAAWGTCWLVENRPAIRDAAIAAGFVVYEADGGALHGSLILCVDGGGYSFTGQHWIPLRAELARQQCRANRVNNGPSVQWLAVHEMLREAADREGETLRFDRMFPTDLGGAS